MRRNLVSLFVCGAAALPVMSQEPVVTPEVTPPVVAPDVVAPPVAPDVTPIAIPDPAAITTALEPEVVQKLTEGTLSSIGSRPVGDRFASVNVDGSQFAVYEVPGSNTNVTYVSTYEFAFEPGSNNVKVTTFGSDKDKSDEDKFKKFWDPETSKMVRVRVYLKRKPDLPGKISAQLRAGNFSKGLIEANVIPADVAYILVKDVTSKDPKYNFTTYEQVSPGAGEIPLDAIITSTEVDEFKQWVQLGAKVFSVTQIFRGEEVRSQQVLDLRSDSFAAFCNELKLSGDVRNGDFTKFESPFVTRDQRDQITRDVGQSVTVKMYQTGQLPADSSWMSEIVAKLKDEAFEQVAIPFSDDAAWAMLKEQNLIVNGIEPAVLDTFRSTWHKTDKSEQERITDLAIKGEGEAGVVMPELPVPIELGFKADFSKSTKEFSKDENELLFTYDLTGDIPVPVGLNLFRLSKAFLSKEQAWVVKAESTVPVLTPLVTQLSTAPFVGWRITGISEAQYEVGDQIKAMRDALIAGKTGISPFINLAASYPTKDQYEARILKAGEQSSQSASPDTAQPEGEEQSSQSASPETPEPEGEKSTANTPATSVEIPDPLLLEIPREGVLNIFKIEEVNSKPGRIVWITLIDPFGNTYVQGVFFEYRHAGNILLLSDQNLPLGYTLSNNILGIRVRSSSEIANNLAAAK